MKSNIVDLENTDIAVKRLLFKNDFYEFFKFFWDVINHEELIDNWHIKYLCNELQIVAERVFRREKKLYDLVINIPPSMSKTSITNIYFPIWCWINDYTIQFINVSYSYQLSTTISEKCRDVIRSDKFKKYFFDIKIKDDSNTKQYFKIQEKDKIGGFRYSTSTGGTIGGIHAHIIALDDTLNPADSVSDSIVRSTNEWLDYVIYSRKVDNEVTPVILIMQRLHENDTTGYMLEKNGKNIKHICLPAKIDSNILPNPIELKQYYKDNLLDCKRLSEDILEQKRLEMGDYAFSMQYLQTVVPRGSNFFNIEKLQLMTVYDENVFEKVVRYWDKAGTSKGGCYTVGVKMAKLTSGKYFVLDVVRGQWEASEREEIIKQTARMDGKDVIVYIEQEPGSGGKESAENTIRNLSGYICIADRPTGDKVTRADTFAVQVNAGNVFILQGSWNIDYKKELEYFPYSKYKDQVDASSGAFNMLSSGKKVKVFDY